ncbi:MAG: hypothetical protein MJ105_03245 [Lachnospiraceae bacterium]|nr:hypothetical protein [Lachnospiraceae bacterium]
MNTKMELLDCTLRDGAYIVDAAFGVAAIKGIIKKLELARVEIIECGWLKNTEHKEGTSFYHVPGDLERYLQGKNENQTYVAMIDWDRYDLSFLPICDHKSIDAIRVVFPQNKFREGIAVGARILEKGYKVYFQAANTYGYSEAELIALAEETNKVMPVSLSVVDTFGTMYEEDLDRIVRTLHKVLAPSIKLGFHSHNNQQLSFALCMHFAKLCEELGRDAVIDASLCGMGRGAGNATTELVSSFLNKKYSGNYDMNEILDAIDVYMEEYKQKFTWGYSTPYFIAGMYCTHVNNIAYLLNNHRTNAKDMRSVIDSMAAEDRKKYDYDVLEEHFLAYQSSLVDDEKTISMLKESFKDREILLVFPGTSAKKQQDCIKENAKGALVIGVNSVVPGYAYDYIFFSRNGRSDYAKENYTKLYEQAKKIITSNIKKDAEDGEYILNYNMLIKRGWEHFDDSGIMCLRLLNRLNVKKVYLAGFDGFAENYEDSYADTSIPHVNPGKSWAELNAEIKEMLQDFLATVDGRMEIKFLTESKYQ